MLQIEITFSPDLPVGTRSQDWFKFALAYAILWGDPNRIVIHVDQDRCISASYQRLNPKTQNYEQYFYMQGIYHADPTRTGSIDQHYTFHS